MLWHAVVDQATGASNGISVNRATGVLSGTARLAVCLKVAEPVGPPKGACHCMVDPLFVFFRYITDFFCRRRSPMAPREKIVPASSRPDQVSQSDTPKLCRSVAPRALPLILQSKPSITFWNSLRMIARWPAGARTWTQT